MDVDGVETWKIAQNQGEGGTATAVCIASGVLGKRNTSERSDPREPSNSKSSFESVAAIWSRPLSTGIIVGRRRKRLATKQVPAKTTSL